MENSITDADDRLTEILLAWEDAKAAGKPVSATVLCQDCPELIETVQCEIERLEAFEIFETPCQLHGLRLPTESPPAFSGGQADRFPGYELLEELGRGGMGVVYKARQRSLARLVAIKTLVGSRWHDPASVARLRQEARLLSRLNHPQIVQVIDIIEQPHSVSLILEYVQGESLAQRLHRSTLAPAEAIQIALALAAALAKMHSEGLMHRDLKPANVLLSSAGEVKITDFGIAKDIDEQQVMTMTGEVLGSPGYMAPEQLDRRIEPIGLTADVYGLGATLYAMLVGRPPFAGGTIIETIDQVRHQDPVAPRLLNPRIPLDLETICLKCLEKEPARRYQTVRDLIDDLWRFSNGESIHARPVSLVRRGWRWCRRQPAIAALLAFASLTVISLVILAAVRNRELAAHSKSLENLNGELTQAVNSAQKLQQLAESRAMEASEGLFASQLTLAATAGREGDFRGQQSLLNSWIPQHGQFDHRDFAWRFLNNQAHRRSELFYAAGSPIYQLGRSPDKTLVAACGQAGKVWLLDAVHGTLVRTIVTDQIEVNGTAFSPDSLQLVTAGDSGTLCIWNVADGTRVRQFPAHPGKAFQVVWSRDGMRLYSCGDDPIIRIFDPATGQSAGTLEGHTSVVQALLDAGDGRTLLSAGDRGEVPLWDLEQRKVISFFRLQRQVGAIGVAPDQSWLATGDDGGSLHIFDLKTKELLATAKHLDRFGALAVHPQGELLAASDEGGIIRLWKFQRRDRSLQQLAAWYAHDGAVSSLLWSPRRDELLSTGADGRILRWALDEVLHYGTRRFGTEPFNNAAFISGSLVAAASSQGLSIWNWKTGRPISTIDSDATHAVVVSRNAKWIVSQRTSPAIIKVFTRNELSGRYEKTAQWAAGGDITMLKLAPDDRHVAVARWKDNGGSPKNEHSIWILPLPDLSPPQQLDVDWSNEAAFAPHGKGLALHVENGLEMWDDRYQTIWKRPQSDVNCLTFSHDGRLLFSRWLGRSITASDARTGEIEFTLAAHRTTIESIALSPDGRDLAMADASGVVTLAHVPARRDLFELANLQVATRLIGFSPSGRELLALRLVEYGKRSEFVVFETDVEQK